MKPSPRRRAAPSVRNLALAALLSGCAEPLPPPDGNVHVTLDISGRVERRGVRIVRPADAENDCIQPQRRRLPTAEGPAPGADQPPNVAFGYAIYQMPRPRLDVRPHASDWLPYGPQEGFSLNVFPVPGALEAEGPVRIGRAFRISVGTPEGLWEREVAEDAPSAEGWVVIAPDGLSGRFHARTLVMQIEHNRMPDEMSITVTGSWRCPAPSRSGPASGRT